MDHPRRYGDIISEAEIEAAITSRTRHIEELHLEVCDLKTQRNAVAARISRLPVETLAQIFKELQTIRSDDYPFRWIVVTHVSRHWRSVALGSANLWSLIRYTHRDDRTRAFLQRSEQTPLRILCVQKTVLSPSTFLSRVAQEAHRIRSVELQTEQTSAAQLEELPVWNTPQLEHISLKIHGHRDELPGRPVLPFLSTADLPALRRLDLEGLGVDGFKAFLRPTLTDLYVNTGFRDLVVPLWVRLVRELPFLQRLDLGGPFTLGEHPIHPVSDTSSLPRLANVTLRDASGSGCSTTFLEHLVPPAGCRIALYTIGFDPEHVDNIRHSVAVVCSRLKDGGGMQSCRLVCGDILSLELWRTVIDFEDDRGAGIPEPDFLFANPETYYYDDSHAFREFVALLPGAEVQKMYCRLGKEMDDEELLSLFPSVTALVVKCLRPAPLLSRLAQCSRDDATVPSLFPALRAVTFDGARWHEHDASCPRPYSDPSLARLVEAMVTARAMSAPLEELLLLDLKNVKEPDDRVEMEALSAKPLSFSWSSAPLETVEEPNDSHLGEHYCQLCWNGRDLEGQIFGSDLELSDPETWDHDFVDSDME